MKRTRDLGPGLVDLQKLHGKKLTGENAVEIAALVVKHALLNNAAFFDAVLFNTRVNEHAVLINA